MPTIDKKIQIMKTRKDYAILHSTFLMLLFHSYSFCKDVIYPDWKHFILIQSIWVRLGGLEALHWLILIVMVTWMLLFQEGIL